METKPEVTETKVEVQPEVANPPEVKKKCNLGSNPPLWLVHVACACVQLAFGLGTVVGKSALAAMPALIFAFYRELFAGIILMAICLIKRLPLPKGKDWFRFMLTGLFLYGNQCLVTVGLSYSPAHVNAIWQPSQPIFTVAIAIMIKYEKATVKKLVGVAFATAGALVITILSTTSSVDSKNLIIASICYFFNCLSTSLYVIASKPLVKKYNPIVVTSVSYIFGTILMMITAVCMFAGQSDKWGIPADGIWQLCYWVLISSVLAYLLMTWANKFVDSSVVSAYTTFQPITSFTFGAIFLGESLIWPDLGAILIIGGLILIIWDSVETKKKEEENSKLASLTSNAQSTSGAIEAKDTETVKVQVDSYVAPVAPVAPIVAPVAPVTTVVPTPVDAPAPAAPVAPAPASASASAPGTI
ncbi:hypothetical protein WA158_006409 [Blastocystis sp. Blastoise]